MHNIKRNKRILEYVQTQMHRLGIPPSLDLFVEEYILVDLGAKDTIEIAPKIAQGKLGPDIFDIDGVLIETLKIVGIMEAAKDEKDLQKLIERREKIKDDIPEKTDFDKILSAMMKVPLPDDKQKKKKK